MMFKNLIFLSLGLAICAGSLHAQIKPGGQMPPMLAALAPDFLVVVGKGAPAPECQAAETIAAALREAGGPADNLLDDETALTDLNRTAFHHCILVGTYSSNALLCQQWGHWSIDRKAFRQAHVKSEDALKSTFYKGAPTSGFFVFGANTFYQDDTGLVECGRNDLFLVPTAVDAPKKPDYKISIHITGVGSAGVARAATAFLNTGLLNGVVPGSDETLPAKGDAFLLAKDQYEIQLPDWVPQTRLLGWLQPNATDYAGFLQASGQAAQHIWRVKYLPTATITNFDSSPQPRSSGNELWIAQLASPEAAQGAVAGLIKTLSGDPQKLSFTASTLGNQPVQHAGDFYVAASGPWLFMETLPGPLGNQVLTEVLTTDKSERP